MTEQAFGLSLERIVIYARNDEASAQFYQTHFRYHQTGDRILELTANVLLRPAAKSQKAGQSSVKLVFDAKDILAFSDRSAENWHEFGPVHEAGGYAFANARDRYDNRILVFSRTFRKVS